MIWNQHLLYQIIDVWYHIRKLYLINNEKNDKIKLNHFFYKQRPIVLGSFYDWFYLVESQGISAPCWTPFDKSYWNPKPTTIDRGLFYERIKLIQDWNSTPIVTHVVSKHVIYLKQFMRNLLPYEYFSTFSVRVLAETKAEKTGCSPTRQVQSIKPIIDNNW